MDLLTIASYPLAIILVVFPIVLVARLRRSYGQMFLVRYQEFLIIHNVIVFTDLIILFMGSQLDIIPPGQFNRLSMLYGFIFIPLMVLLSWMYLQLALSLLKKRAGPRLTGLYLAFWALFLCGFIAAEVQFFTTGSFQLTQVLEYVFNGALFVIYCGTFLYTLQQASRAQESWRRRLIRALFIYYSAVILMIFLSRTVLSVMSVDALLIRLYALLYNIPPVLYISHVLRTSSAPTAEAGRQNEFNSICTRHGITRREREIIRGILEGKSNKEIVDELIISERTVETHVYNIYRKLGVKNRIQLMNQFRPGD